MAKPRKEKKMTNITDGCRKIDRFGFDYSSPLAFTDNRNNKSLSFIYNTNT